VNETGRRYGSTTALLGWAILSLAGIVSPIFGDGGIRLTRAILVSSLPLHLHISPRVIWLTDEQVLVPVVSTGSFRTPLGDQRDLRIYSININSGKTALIANLKSIDDIQWGTNRSKHAFIEVHREFVRPNEARTTDYYLVDGASMTIASVSRRKYESARHKANPLLFHSRRLPFLGRFGADALCSDCRLGLADNNGRILLVFPLLRINAQTVHPRSLLQVSPGGNLLMIEPGMLSAAIKYRLFGISNESIALVYSYLSTIDASEAKRFNTVWAHDRRDTDRFVLSGQTFSGALLDAQGDSTR
jgi:hypothetical protein